MPEVIPIIFFCSLPVLVVAIPYALGYFIQFAEPKIHQKLRDYLSKYNL